MAIGKCAYTGVPINDTADGIWDEGEWISWEYINQQQAEQDEGLYFPPVSQELKDIFQSLVHIASNYKNHTGRYLDIFGELGELYAEIQLGLNRHRLNAPGSDGRVGKRLCRSEDYQPFETRR